ncbi:hypothetical protein EON66_02285 [archaeon]|nr:MAG: hypothetical protein EON66_02285 [archaeon]
MEKEARERSSVTAIVPTPLTSLSDLGFTDDQLTRLTDTHDALSSDRMMEYAGSASAATAAAAAAAFCDWASSVATLHALEPRDFLLAAVDAGESRIPLSLAQETKYLVLAPKGMTLAEKLSSLTHEDDKLALLRHAVRDVLLALVRAHAMGVRHEDVRVPNIIWVEGDSVTGGHAVLIDWGLCYRAESTKHVAKTPAPIKDVTMLLHAYRSLLSEYVDFEESTEAPMSSSTLNNVASSTMVSSKPKKQVTEWQPPDRFCAALKLAAEGVFGPVAPGASAT